MAPPTTALSALDHKSTCMSCMCYERRHPIIGISPGKTGSVWFAPHCLNSFSCPKEYLAGKGGGVKEQMIISLRNDYGVAE